MAYFELTLADELASMAYRNRTIDYDRFVECVQGFRSNLEGELKAVDGAIDAANGALYSLHVFEGVVKDSFILETVQAAKRKAKRHLKESLGNRKKIIKKCDALDNYLHILQASRDPWDDITEELVEFEVETF